MLNTTHAPLRQSPRLLCTGVMVLAVGTFLLIGAGALCFSGELTGRKLVGHKSEAQQKANSVKKLKTEYKGILEEYVVAHQRENSPPKACTKQQKCCGTIDHVNPNGRYECKSVGASCQAPYPGSATGPWPAHTVCCGSDAISDKFKNSMLSGNMGSVCKYGAKGNYDDDFY